MTNIPRDKNGNFVQVDLRETRNENQHNTVGVIDEEHITPNIQWVNLTVKFLQEAIERAEEHGIVRLGTFNKTDELDSGEKSEVGMATLKSKPSDDEVVLVVGRRREYDP